MQHNNKQTEHDSYDAYDSRWMWPGLYDNDSTYMMCGMCKHGPDMRWLTWYGLMYMIHDMTYMTDRIHGYSMN